MCRGELVCAVRSEYSSKRLSGGICRFILFILIFLLFNFASGVVQANWARQFLSNSTSVFYGAFEVTFMYGVSSLAISVNHASFLFSAGICRFLQLGRIGE